MYMSMWSRVVSLAVEADLVAWSRAVAVPGALGLLLAAFGRGSDAGLHDEVDGSTR